MLALSSRLVAPCTALGSLTKWAPVRRAWLAVALASCTLAAAVGVTGTLSSAGTPVELPAVHELAPALSDGPLAGSGLRGASATSEAERDQAADSYGKLPLAFEQNRGQTDGRVDYLSRAAGHTAFLTSTGTTLALDPAGKGAHGAALRLGLTGADPAAKAVGQNRLPGDVNVLRGDDPSQWTPGAETFARVRYQDVYPGIDLAWYGTQEGRLEYDFIVRPGADPSAIGLELEGAQRIALTNSGALRIKTAAGTLVQRPPVAYQQIGGRRHAVESRYELSGSRVQLVVGDYDRSHRLVIDPVLAYSTFLGGVSDDEGTAIEVDGQGNAYVTGSTRSANYPTTLGAYDTTHNGVLTEDVFVTKLNPAGSGLVYSTFVGGTGRDRAEGIAIDAAGAAYLTGYTDSANYPTTPGAYDTSYNGNEDPFVTKLDSSGSTLVYSTFLGGNSIDRGSRIAVDSQGSAYTTGFAASANYPTTPGAFDTTYNGNVDAYATKLTPSGAALAYSTFLGGTSNDQGGFGIAVDGQGDAYVTGNTASADYPTTPGAYDTTYNGNEDAFVSKLNSAGSALVYSTFLGGTLRDDDNSIGGNGIAVDPLGSAYVTGSTQSPDYPTTPGAYDTTYNGTFDDAYVTKLNPAGSALVYSTFLGGTSYEEANDITIDGQGAAYVTGRTQSPNFPTADAYDPTYNGSDDAYVTKLNAAGSALVFSTFLGGSSFDEGNGVAVDSQGGIYVTGATGSPNYPTIPEAYDTTYTFGNLDAFVTKLALGPGAPANLTLEPAADTNTVGDEHCVTATVTDDSGEPVPDVAVRFSVSGANSADGEATTDANGEAEFCYTGTNAGDDTIAAFADTDADQQQDAGEPADSATKHWRAGAPANLTLEPAAATNTVGDEHCVTATVTDEFGNPVPDTAVSFSVSGANSAQGEVTTDENGEAEFCYTGTNAGQDTIEAEAQGGSNPSASAQKTWTPGPPANLTLTPAAATNTVGDEHCVTATVTDEFGNPVPGVTVRFDVSGANDRAGSDTTDSNGEAEFCYTGTFPGADTIDAFADTDSDGDQDAGEPADEATKTWVLPQSTEGCKVTDGGRITAANGDKASFGANAQVKGGVKGEQTYQDHGPATPLKVKSIEILAVTCSSDRTRATIFGTAQVNGQGSFDFRVDVADNGEPGTADTYRIRLSNGYDSGEQPLEGGNVQIHR